MDRSRNRMKFQEFFEMFVQDRHIPCFVQLGFVSWFSHWPLQNSAAWNSSSFSLQFRSFGTNNKVRNTHNTSDNYIFLMCSKAVQKIKKFWPHLVYSVCVTPSCCHGGILLRLGAHMWLACWCGDMHWIIEIEAERPKKYRQEKTGNVFVRTT